MCAKKNATKRLEYDFGDHAIRLTICMENDCISHYMTKGGRACSPDVHCWGFVLPFVINIEGLCLILVLRRLVSGWGKCNKRKRKYRKADLQDAVGRRGNGERRGTEGAGRKVRQR